MGDGGTNWSFRSILSSAPVTEMKSLSTRPLLHRSSSSISLWLVGQVYVPMVDIEKGGKVYILEFLEDWRLINWCVWICLKVVWILTRTGRAWFADMSSIDNSANHVRRVPAGWNPYITLSFGVTWAEPKQKIWKWLKVAWSTLDIFPLQHVISSRCTWNRHEK